jgi:hypothetical protein
MLPNIPLAMDKVSKKIKPCHESDRVGPPSPLRIALRPALVAERVGQESDRRGISFALAGW